MYATRVEYYSCAFVFGIIDNSKIIHFVGIGGIGVSGLAEILHSLGCVVQGSDRSNSQNCERLRKIGVPVFIDHDAKNIGNADVVVYSSAINCKDNPELEYAKRNNLPILTRAEMLSQIIRFKKSIVVAGSHGKTTVTSLCASILEMAPSFNPTVINGGVINAYQTNAKLGNGDWVVVESDESDGSFVKFLPTIGLVTNIDHEHINHYGTFENLKSAFINFIENTPFYGCCIACSDDKNVREIIRDIYDRKIVTYSLNDDNSHYRAVNIKYDEKGSTFEVICQKNLMIKDVAVPLFGEHNVRNSLAAIAMAIELKIDIDSVVRPAISGFAGVKRRFTHVGSINGVKFIDDYAHHPTEISATLKGAYHSSKKRVAIVCQPHRFTRLNNLFDDFVNSLSSADIRIIVPVYKADDSDDGSLKSEDLYNALAKKTKETYFCPDEFCLEKLLYQLIYDEKKLEDGDIVLFAGAGSISRWAHQIYNNLA